MAQGQSGVSGPTRALQEAELTSEEVERILKVCGPHALLVGGQALATWALTTAFNRQASFPVW